MISTGSARRILHLKVPGFILRKSLWRSRLKAAPARLASPDLASRRSPLPNPARPSFIPMAIIEIVGGPPIRTGGPAGIGRTTLVGSTSDLVLLFFFGLGGGGMPTHWQLNAGSAM